MLRKRTAQEALLLSPESSSLYAESVVSNDSVVDDSLVALRLTASCGGVIGRVKIFEDASFSFAPHEVI